MRILAIEPYYGGSHQAFLDQWIEKSVHQWQLVTLPAHHWKWRMRHAPIWSAEKVRQLWRSGARWDVLFCSDMLDLAAFLGLAGSAICQLPAVVYFHENQLTYPTRFDQQRDLHFALTNFTTALAAREVWFNSHFHSRSFFTALQTWLRSLPDYPPLEQLRSIEAKSHIQPPGIDVQGIQQQSTVGPLHIAWAARWEHDKGPEFFFAALRILKQQQIDFRITICGQVFREIPTVFQQAEREFHDHICHWGPIESHTDYLHKLSRADVFVSTAQHEFFGLSVMESIAMGLTPLLPNRLSYPELLDAPYNPATSTFIYDGSSSDLADRLITLARAPRPLLSSEQRALLADIARRYHWSNRATAMDHALENAATSS